MSMLFFGVGGTVVTETFTSNVTWVSPASTNKIMSMQGKGSDGTAPNYTLQNTLKVYDVDYQIGSGGAFTSPVITWASMNAYVTAGLAILNDPSSTDYSFPSMNVIQFSNGTYNKTNINITIPGAHVRQAGTAYSEIFNNASNPIDSDGTAFVTYYYLDNGAYGTAATAFGQSCAGGTPSTTAAPTTTYTNISISPSTSYPIVVPSGGYITITYAK